MISEFAGGECICAPNCAHSGILEISTSVKCSATEKRTKTIQNVSHCRSSAPPGVSIARTDDAMPMTKGSSIAADEASHAIIVSASRMQKKPAPFSEHFLRERSPDCRSLSFREKSRPTDFHLRAPGRSSHFGNLYEHWFDGSQPKRRYEKRHETSPQSSTSGQMPAATHGKPVDDVIALRIRSHVGTQRPKPRQRWLHCSSPSFVASSSSTSFTITFTILSHSLHAASSPPPVTIENASPAISLASWIFVASETTSAAVVMKPQKPMLRWDMD